MRILLNLVVAIAIGALVGYGCGAFASRNADRAVFMAGFDTFVKAGLIGGFITAVLVFAALTLKRS